MHFSCSRGSTLQSPRPRILPPPCVEPGRMSDVIASCPSSWAYIRVHLYLLCGDSSYLSWVKISQAASSNLKHYVRLYGYLSCDSAELCGLFASCAFHTTVRVQVLSGRVSVRRSGRQRLAPLILSMNKLVCVMVKTGTELGHHESEMVESLQVAANAAFACGRKSPQKVFQGHRCIHFNKLWLRVLSRPLQIYPLSLDPSELTRSKNYRPRFPDYCRLTTTPSLAYLKVMFPYILSYTAKTSTITNFRW